MAENWRLFIALELPPTLREALAVQQADLKRSAPRGAVRWVDPAGIHLTLKFLGETPSDRREAIEAGLHQAGEAHQPFALLVGGLGCFPDFKRPRVVWSGILKGRAELSALRDSVEQYVAPLGYPTEKRAFSPHLTLGRVRRETSRDDAARLGSLVNRTTPGDLQRWPVQSICLIRSVLTPNGAQYTTLCDIPLGSTSAHPSDD